MKEGMQCLGAKWSLRNTSEIVEYWYEVLGGIKYWIEREQAELKYEPSAEEKAAGIAQFSLAVGEMATITALAKDYSKDPDDILEWKYGKVYNLLFTNLQSHLFRERLNKELERKAQQKANARKPRNKMAVELEQILAEGPHSNEGRDHPGITGRRAGSFWQDLCSDNGPDGT